MSHVVILNWRDHWHPEGGGSETYLRQVSTRLAGAGHQVTTLTARYPGSARSEVVDGVRYVRVGKHMTVYLWAAFYLLTRRLGRIDHVIEVQNGMPFLAHLFTRAKVTVLVHHVHREQWPVVGPVLAKVGWFMESRVAPRVNRSNDYVAVSQVTASELVQLGVDEHRIRIAYNGVPPVPEFTAPPRDEHPSLVALSRLVPHKQIEHAVRTLDALRDEIPDATLTVMGDGWWADQLREMVVELGLEDRVRLLGFVDDTTKFEELSRAWVHVMPSLKEGWGLSIVEAAHVGVPSVAYRSAGGVQESILDGVTGLLAQDQDDFTDCVRRLLTDPALREGMGAKAKLRSEQFTWEATTAVIEGCLQPAG
ncbi:glycosyltransferase family 4 protein [Nocardioides daphniae]|uniref:Glycosyl transferase n=1 Tax=Nocardioides daphniae TaxID=402297 RepID=A0A4P7UC24_9ACTN|nr:glycosyltransferase family 4 protein [Nocardioides daphniae]QCC77061.1 glycosyltransferase family 1 protein [Nocardioides daphniae]GGD19180.1 glycosyl transferase [Nocardioides daphniae]